LSQLKPETNRGEPLLRATSISEKLQQRGAQAIG